MHLHTCEKPCILSLRIRAAKTDAVTFDAKVFIMPAMQFIKCVYKHVKNRNPIIYIVSQNSCCDS